MDFKFQIGTKVLFGRNCVKANGAEFSKLGARAFIVTGRSSGKASGALGDTTELLKDAGIAYMVYDRVDNNPTLENVKDAGMEAAAFEADFIIGIGGGSPLDAAKAAAVLAVNTVEPVELFKNIFSKKPLPVIAIPTTAGTGSEVTPYSILTRRDLETKMSFGNEDTFPKVAFMDARYTMSLDREVTVNTAVDALSHAVEGYLSRRSTAISDVFAIEAVEVFGQCLPALINGDFDFEAREKLLYSAMLGGMTISHTGTTIVHGIGYSLTYFRGLPHGRANGLLMAEYLRFNYEYVREKINKVLGLLGMKTIDELKRQLSGILNKGETFDEKEFSRYAALAMKQKSTSYNIRNVTETDMQDIMRKSLL